MDAVSNEGGNEAGGGKLARWMDGTRRDSTGLRVGVGVGVGVGRGDGVFGMRETMRRE